MTKKIKLGIKKNIEVFLLIILILIASIYTTYFNYQKNNEYRIYNDFVENVYLKKHLIM